MTVITKNGRELSNELAHYIGGSTTRIDETCSLIARHAKTYHTLMECECNGAFHWMRDGEHLSDSQAEWLSDRVDTIEARITRLVEDLPETDDGPFTVRFQGDPRGRTVIITAPDGREMSA